LFSTTYQNKKSDNNTKSNGNTKIFPKRHKTIIKGS
jgi:hypothetical protein